MSRSIVVDGDSITWGHSVSSRSSVSETPAVPALLIEFSCERSRSGIDPGLETTPLSIIAGLSSRLSRLGVLVFPCRRDPPAAIEAA
jgi:hypothetical protein